MHERNRVRCEWRSAFDWSHTAQWHKLGCSNHFCARCCHHINLQRSQRCRERKRKNERIINCVRTECAVSDTEFCTPANDSIELPPLFEYQATEQFETIQLHKWFHDSLHSLEDRSGYTPYSLLEKKWRKNIPSMRSKTAIILSLKLASVTLATIVRSQLSFVR